MLSPPCFLALLGMISVSRLAGDEPRSSATTVTRAAGAPDAVATMIMHKPIFPLAVHAVAFSPDGRTLATGDGQGTLRLWDPASGTLRAQAPAHSNWVFSISWTADGSALITGGGDNLIRWREAAHLDRAVRTILSHSNDVHAVALTRDGRTLFSAGDDRQIVVWDVNRAAEVRRLAGHDRQIPALKLSPSEKLLASGSRDHSIKLWDAETGIQRDTLVGHTGDVVALDFSPDGSLLASAGWDNTARLWDVAQGKAVRVFPVHPNWVYSVAFSPDGRRLASSSGPELSLFDVASGRVVWAVHFQGLIRGEDGKDTAEDLSTVAFSPDGKLVAVGSTNGSVYVVRAESGERVQRLAPPGP